MKPNIPMTPSRLKEPGLTEAHPKAVSVTAIEKMTGLTKEVIRKWESRYGFPCPERDENGDRTYPAEQVMRLQLIRRLLGAGMRPGKVVGLDLETLRRLTEQTFLRKAPPPSECCRQVLDALVSHDFDQMTQLLKRQLTRQGLSLFVQDTVSRLNFLIGEGWLRGEIKIFEEHVYSEFIEEILYTATHAVTDPSISPRVLLTTPPGEIHKIGLLMANAMFSLEGAFCISLGTQTPPCEILAAVVSYQIDIVALSFSINLPARCVTLFLRDLRSRLDPSVQIWAGGGGISRLRRIAGVIHIRDIEDVAPAIRAWKACRDKSSAIE